MAFTDALIDHSDVTVALVDRRHGAGGHWLDAYPFVRLHQASAFYGVPSTLLGGGRIQQDGPEQGLHERATAPEVCAYFDRVLRERFIASGRVTFHPSSEYVGDGRIVSRVSGRAHQLRPGARVVNASYLSPQIPATTPPPFGVSEGARVVPVHELVDLGGAPSQFVVVGSGKTATDACIWLLGNGVDPDAICWVRPRDPWMLNRAVVQPDPVVFLGLAADTMEAATEATSSEDLFLRLEERGVLLRIDRSVMGTMAKTPTLATWELDLLRTIENVVRLGHIQSVDRGRLVLDAGEVTVADDAVVVHCAAAGLQYPPLVPIWGAEAITLQPIRSGFPCFGAALAGFVEATFDDDAEKNRLCPPSPLSDTPTDWCRMQVLGGRASMAFSTDPDIRRWVAGVALNPSRVPPEMEGDPRLVAVMERYKSVVVPGMAKLTELAGMSAD
ncbi:NAD(P)/FAD-dependent oxidoreductase [Nocardioides dilutus]